MSDGGAPGGGPLRPIFCGNFEYEARPSEVERLFTKYGAVDRVDMKTGFAFVYMTDERDAKDAIRALDNMEFGRQRRRLVVEWARGEGGRRRDDDGMGPPRGGGGFGGGGGRRDRSMPSKTLFVVNFDPVMTKEDDLRRIYEKFGKLVRCQIRKNYAFVQYELQDDATEALEKTKDSEVNGRPILVEYAREERRSMRDFSPPRGRGRSPSPPPRRSPRYSPRYDRYGSPPPSYRERSPPRYTRGRSPPQGYSPPPPRRSYSPRR